MQQDNFSLDKIKIQVLLNLSKKKQSHKILKYNLQLLDDLEKYSFWNLFSFQSIKKKDISLCYKELKSISMEKKDTYFPHYELKKYEADIIQFNLDPLDPINISYKLLYNEFLFCIQSIMINFLRNQIYSYEEHIEKFIRTRINIIFSNKRKLENIPQKTLKKFSLDKITHYQLNLHDNEIYGTYLSLDKSQFDRPFVVGLLTPLYKEDKYFQSTISFSCPKNRFLKLGE